MSVSSDGDLARGLVQLPPDLLGASVSGVNLMPGSLGDQLGDRPTLLVFLRHFGCIFCREMVADLKAVVEADAGFPPVIFFFQGTPTEGRAFLRRYWRDARAVADSDGRMYAAFGIERGTWMQTLGPGVWSANRRASAKGHENGDRTGDIWRMPGVFLVSGDEIVWAHDFRHAGEALDLGSIPRDPGTPI